MSLRTLLALVPLLALAVPAGAQTTAPAGTPVALLPLYRDVEALSFTDADLPAALKALKDATGLVAVVEGPVPERKTTLSLKKVPGVDVLDALAALYGLQWETRTTTIVLSPRERPAAGAGGPSLAQAQQVIQWLRDAGFGEGPPPPFSSGVADVYSRLGDLFTPEQRRQMAQAGDNAAQFGVRVRDLPQDLQRQLLVSKENAHRSSALGALWRAARPFDPEEVLGSTVYFRTGPDGSTTLMVGVVGPNRVGPSYGVSAP